MRNDTETVEVQPASQPAPTLQPVPASPFHLLSSDDDALCTDELCLPADARPVDGTAAPS